MTPETVYALLLTLPLLYFVALLIAAYRAGYFDSPRPTLLELPPVQHEGSPCVCEHRVTHPEKWGVQVRITSHHTPLWTPEED